MSLDELNINTEPHTSIELDKQDTNRQDESNRDARYIDNKNLIYLKAKYEMNKYPTKHEMSRMAEETSLRYSKIYNWFHTERDRKNETKSIKYSDGVLKILEKELKKTALPSRETKLKLAKKTRLTFLQVGEWFRRKRSMKKKKAKN